MADGTRFAQLTEGVAANRKETTRLSETVAATRQEITNNSETLRVPATMADRTRFAQLTEGVAANRQETTRLSETVAATRQEITNNSETLRQHTELLNTLMNGVSIFQFPGSHNGENSGEKNGEKSGENSYVESGVYTRPLKLDFPRCDEPEPNNWILKAQQFHPYYNTLEDQKVPVAGFHMEGRALKWYHWLMDAGYAGGWDDFVSALKIRFAPLKISVEEVVQEEETETEPQEAELLGISLHVLAGALTPQTMRVMGKIGEQQVVILIYTGSTHSLVDQHLAQKIRLPAEEMSQLTVMVANGEKVPHPRCCVAATFKLQRYEFQANLHLLTLGYCDMVLGVDWLNTLGPILWDFIKLTMKFTHHTREILLQGQVPAASNLEVVEQLPKKKRVEHKGIWLQLIGVEIPQSKKLQHPTITELHHASNQ